MEYLKDILIGRGFRKLFTCLLIFQPLSPKELKYFLPFLYWFAKYKKFIDIDRVITKTEKKFNISIKRLAIFTDKDLYSSNGIIKKAVNSNLILEIPSKKGEKKNSYYFVNSDLIFKINKASKLEIIEADKYRNYLHEIDNEKIASVTTRYFCLSPHPFPARAILHSFSWIIKHGDKLEKIWNQKLSKNPFRGNLYKKSIKDGIIHKDFDGYYKLFEFFNEENFFVRFSPSYKLLNCFPEIDIDYEKTPIQNLKEIINGNYEIDPNKRAKKFTSLLVQYDDISDAISNIHFYFDIFVYLFEILYGSSRYRDKKEAKDKEKIGKYLIVNEMATEIYNNLRKNKSIPYLP